MEVEFYQWTGTSWSHHEYFYTTYANPSNFSIALPPGTYTASVSGGTLPIHYGDGAWERPSGPGQPGTFVVADGGSLSRTFAYPTFSEISGVVTVGGKAKAGAGVSSTGGTPPTPGGMSSTGTALTGRVATPSRRCATGPTSPCWRSVRMPVGCAASPARRQTSSVGPTLSTPRRLVRVCSRSLVLTRSATTSGTRPTPLPLSVAAQRCGHHGCHGSVLHAGGC
jgi:hypothetical protein